MIPNSNQRTQSQRKDWNRNINKLIYIIMFKFKRETVQCHLLFPTMTHFFFYQLDKMASTIHTLEDIDFPPREKF